MNSGVLSITKYENEWTGILKRNGNKAQKLLKENYNPMRTFEWDLWKTRDMMVRKADENLQFNKENLENVFLEPLAEEDVLKRVMDKSNWSMKELIQAHNKDLYVRFLRIAGLPKEKYLKNRRSA